MGRVEPIARQNTLPAMASKMDQLRRSAARALRAARAAKTREEADAHYTRADTLKSLAANFGRLMRNASTEEQKRALRSSRGLWSNSRE